MKVADFNKIKKLMQQVRCSATDGEMLNAIKAATRIVEGAGVDWERILNKMVTLEMEDFQEPERSINKPRQTPPSLDTERQRISAMFDRVYDKNLSTSATEFIDSLHEQFTSRGFLTPKQYDSLETFDRGR